MTFAELLRVYIGDRTLDEVAARCAAKGVKLDPSYISKLRRGTRSAPNDEQVVRVLAEVCRQDPKPLVLLARLERNPRKVIEEQPLKEWLYQHYRMELEMHLHETVRHVEQMLEAADCTAAGIRSYLAERRPASDSLQRQQMDVSNELLDIRRYAGKLLSAAVEIPTAQTKTEDELLQDLANAADVPAEALGNLLAALKQVAAPQKSKKERSTTASLGTPGAFFAAQFAGGLFPPRDASKTKREVM